MFASIFVWKPNESSFPLWYEISCIPFCLNCIMRGNQPTNKTKQLNRKQHIIRVPRREKESNPPGVTATLRSHKTVICTLSKPARVGSIAVYSVLVSYLLARLPQSYTEALRTSTELCISYWVIANICSLRMYLSTKSNMNRWETSFDFQLNQYLIKKLKHHK